MTEPAGVDRLRTELAGYPPSSVTVRVLTAMLTVLPDAAPLPPYSSLDQASALVFGGVPEDVVERARVLAANPRVEQAMFAARSIDTGDTGLTIVSGVRSALSLFFGKSGTRSAAVAQQQRTDAALKALGMAYLVTRLVPLPPADRVELIRSIPAGQELIQYYGAIEIALPFAEQVTASNGTFVADLVRDQGRAMADRLLGIAGREGIADAEALLAHLTTELDHAALAAVPHTSALAEKIGALLPAAASAGHVFDLAAAGADALPCYRYLVARLAIEASIALAKHEAMPDVPLPSVVAAPTAPTPPAPPIPAGLRTASAATAPQSTPEPSTLEPSTSEPWASEPATPEPA
ncbi:MAG: hypothetical protein ABMB14_11990, partial [Myxococcota bacterium]